VFYAAALLQLVAYLVINYAEKRKKAADKNDD